MKKTSFRIASIFIISLLAGFLFNQLHPSGISWRLLLTPVLSGNSLENSEATIMAAPASFDMWQRDSVILVDIRPDQEYELDHIPGAVHISLRQLKAGTFPEKSEWQAGKKILLYDQEGNMNDLKLAAALFTSRKFSDIYLLFGGYLAWLQEGYPVRSGGGQHE